VLTFAENREPGPLLDRSYHLERLPIAYPLDRHVNALTNLALTTVHTAGDRLRGMPMAHQLETDDGHHRRQRDHQ
jgi:hypothetical protein